MKLAFSITILLLHVGVATVVAQSASTGDPPAAAPPAAPPASSVPHKNYGFTEALTYLAGEYAIEKRNHDTYRPTWASLWPLASKHHDWDFSIFFWPPKHCHAIHICAVSKTAESPFNEFKCDTSYIKYYPHIGKLYFKASEDAKEVEGFHQYYSLHFKRKGEPIYEFKIQDKLYDSYSSWLKRNSKVSEWDLSEKNMLIITNSRLCEVNMPNRTYFPIFDEKNTEGAKDLFPQWLTHKGAQLLTDAIATYPTGKKTVDLLSYLLKRPYTQKKLGRIEQRCNSYEKIGISGSLKPAFESSTHVSVASYQMSQRMDSGPHVLMFELSLAECQWVRIWASPRDDIKDYNKTLDVNHALDLFITEGFYVAPGSDQAEPLPDSRHMERVKLVFHSDPKSDRHPLVEMWFGTYEDEYLFRQFFYSDAFGQRTVTFHVIKSPNCEANILTDNPFRFEKKTTDELPNYLQVDTCSYGRFVTPLPEEDDD